jgi:hypothetical protein
MASGSCLATDPPGNRSSCEASITIVDTHPPVVTPGPGPSQLQCNVDTWTDPGATALDQCVGNLSSVKASGTVDPTHVGSYAVTYSATDPSGNVGSATRSVAVIDTLAPSLTPPGTITSTATSTSGAVVSYTAAFATDLCVGPVMASCAPQSGFTFPPGTTAVTCTASDPAGNTATGSFPVQVLYPWSGILQPINADGTSIFKLGSTVAVKFQLTGASADITNALATLTIAKVSSAVDGTYLEAVSNSAADTGNRFRYVSGQYLFNLATKGLSTGTWSLSINLGDGVSRTVQISLR